MGNYDNRRVVSRANEPEKAVARCTASRYAAAMTTNGEFEIFLATAPGLEPVLRLEALALGFAGARYVPGGVTVHGTWTDVWRANLQLRGANRVLARLGSMRVPHIAQLDKRARQFDWGTVLRKDVAVRVEATCHKSRIYHSDAAVQRIETAIREELGAPISVDAEITIMARIENDVCTISVDTSGELLHKRGYKAAVAKAPMRETMAALFLRQCGYDGSEPVVDPMCGSGTFVIEAAEIAAGLAPGRLRHFAFEKFANFDAGAWERMRAAVMAPHETPAVRFYGSDRDRGAVEMSHANAARSGVSALVDFRQHAISDLKPPDGPAGLVMVNPPYGTRVGELKKLPPLYRALGETLRTRFGGWRVGIIGTEASLAAETGLPFLPPGAPVSHGGLRVMLFRTGVLVGAPT